MAWNLVLPNILTTEYAMWGCVVWQFIDVSEKSILYILMTEEKSGKQQAAQSATSLRAVSSSYLPDLIMEPVST
jgi:hypothetical protein